MKAENRESRWQVNREGTPYIKLLEIISSGK